MPVTARRSIRGLTAPAYAAGRRNRWMVAVVLLAALAARVAYVLATSHYVPYLQDARSYNALARGLATGHGWTAGRSAYRPPGYPFLLGLVYHVLGVPPVLHVSSGLIGAHATTAGGRTLDGGWVTPRLAEAVIATGTVALVGWLVDELCGRTAALAAMALGAVYLSLIVVGVSIESEALVVPLTLVAVCCALRSRRGAHPLRWVAAAGLFCGLATLTHENVLVVVPALAVVVWRHAAVRRAWKRLAAPLVLVATAALTIAPWTVRNAIIEHRFVLVSTELGPTLSGTYNSFSAGHRFIWASQSHYANYAAIRDAPHRNDAIYNSRLTGAVLRYIGHHPVDVPAAMFWNTVRLLDLGGLRISRFSAYVDVGAHRAVADWTVYSFWVVGLLALVGLCTPAARRVPRSLWLVPLLLWLGEAPITTGTPRFRAVLEPWFLLLAALALVSFTRALRGRQETAMSTMPITTNAAEAIGPTVRA